MTEPKFCKDCKHFLEAGGIASFYGASINWPESCNQPPERELIRGRKTPASPTRMRSVDGACKPEALLWEEKPPEPESISPEAIVYSPTEYTIPELRATPRELPARWWEFWK